MPHPSYVHGASAIPLIGLPISRYFADACRRHADRPALIVPYQHVRWSYAELAGQVDRLACSLIRLGLQPGERVGIWSQNNSEWVLAQFATARAGLVLVNINPAYRRAELEYALNKVGCAALIVSPGFKSSDYLDMLYDLAPEWKNGTPGRLTSARLPSVRLVIRLGDSSSRGMLNFSALLVEPADGEREALESLNERIQFDDPVNIQFTSGTTGSPKGATLSHHNILNNGFFVAEAMRLTADDRLCIPVPLYHCFGMVLGNLACLT
ncbi:MAG: AMP-binding protein, partial [Microvirgula sp.]